MSHFIVRGAFVLVTGALLSLACSSDKQPARSAEDVPPADPPSAGSQVDATTPAPNGEPTKMPPSDPPPHGDPPASPAAGADPEAPPPQTEPARARLTEGQVARITELANAAEIEQAKLADSRAKAKSVKHFAAMMVKDHTEAKNEQATLYKGLGIMPADSQRSRSLKQDADKTLGQLRAANGAPFDTAYMEAQVTEHQQVLDLINQELVPSAT